MEAPPHNLQDLKDLLLITWGHITLHTFRGYVELMHQQGRLLVNVNFKQLLLLFFNDSNNSEEQYMTSVAF